MCEGWDGAGAASEVCSVGGIEELRGGAGGGDEDDGMVVSNCTGVRWFCEGRCNVGEMDGWVSKRGVGGNVGWCVDGPEGGLVDAGAELGLVCVVVVVLLRVCSGG